MARRGISLIETLAAAGILAVLMAVCLPFFAAAAAQREAGRQQALALQEAANALERMSARSWSALAARPDAATALSPEGRRGLPGGELKIAIDDAPGRPAAKRITVAVRWQIAPDSGWRPCDWSRGGIEENDEAQMTWGEEQGGGQFTAHSPGARGE